MKPSAFLINMSRGPIVDEAALIDVSSNRRIAGAGIDAFDEEPLPPEHPLRSMPNVIATPHLGYVTSELYRTFYKDSATNIESWLCRTLSAT
jgi:phosphoglycerate dehydrogenase-like enzyme